MKQEIKNTLNKRYEIVDQIRGFAVLLMIIFHFFYDLNIFGHVIIDFQQDLFWWWFPRVIVFLFLTAMGISLPITHPKGDPIKWSKFWRRFFKISFYASVISIGTYFLFPSRWVYFGTLHCIAVCALLALPFIHRPLVASLIGSSILVSLLFNVHYPFFKLPHTSMDYIPALPWVAVVLLGIFWHSKGLHRVNLPLGSIGKAFSWMGRYSLWIYLIHQPFLYGLIMIFSRS